MGAHIPTTFDMPFVKLDCGIIHSSLWAEDSDTKICWITLLLLADATGFVRAAASAIAREAGIPAEVARRALDLFQGPDDESRTPDNQGKRVEKVDGGYRVLNYEKYRERDYTNAERQKRWRESQKSNVTTVTEALPVTPHNTCRSRVQKQNKKESANKSRGECEEIYAAYPRKVAKPEALKAIEKAISRGTDFAGLLARTKLYASLVDSDPRFIPHPATWFNQERFNDDPATWRNGSTTKAKEKAPSYQKITPPRELTAEEEAEAERARKIAREETARLKDKLRNG